MARSNEAPRFLLLLEHSHRGALAVRHVCMDCRYSLAFPALAFRSLTFRPLPFRARASDGGGGVDRGARLC
ncbi:hypothetical protein CLOM_g23682 [Closterium sp. NIES-68]|nr:hypothetical protein CLOM_g23682 [Closterium sp. NIES-68]